MHVVCLACVLIYIKSTMCVNIITKVKILWQEPDPEMQRRVSEMSTSCLLKRSNYDDLYFTSKKCQGAFEQQSANEQRWERNQNSSSF